MSFNEIYDEVEKLRGLLSAFQVCYPDTGVRIEPCVNKIDMVLGSPSDRTIYYLVEDLKNILTYFNEIEAIAPSLTKQLVDIRFMIQRLMGPVNPSDDSEDYVKKDFH